MGAVVTETNIIVEEIQYHTSRNVHRLDNVVTLPLLETLWEM